MPLPQFIYDGNVMTPQELARQRAQAEAMSGGPRGIASNVGEGLAQLGQALAGRIAMSRADASQKKIDGGIAGLMKALGGGTKAPAQAAAPTPKNTGRATPKTNDDFVNMLMPAAIEQAKRLGIDPRIIVAQAAQETGWGKKAPGNNFFGIKSHGQGGGQNLATHEVVNGKRVAVNDSFRAFNSPEDSVAGYADFLIKNPRYKPMLQAKGLDAQIAALGQSGYATDPNYAASVGSIARSIPPPSGATQIMPTSAPPPGMKDQSRMVAPATGPQFEIPGGAAASPSVQGAMAGYGNPPQFNPNSPPPPGQPEISNAEYLGQFGEAVPSSWRTFGPKAAFAPFDQKQPPAPPPMPPAPQGMPPAQQAAPVQPAMAPPPQMQQQPMSAYQRMMQNSLGKESASNFPTDGRAALQQAPQSGPEGGLMSRLGVGSSEGMEAPQQAAMAPQQPTAAPGGEDRASQLRGWMMSPYFPHLATTQQQMIKDEYDRELQRAEPPDPMKALQQEKLQIEVDGLKKPKADLINGGDGRLYDPGTGKWIIAPDAGGEPTATQNDYNFALKQLRERGVPEDKLPTFQEWAKPKSRGIVYKGADGSEISVGGTDDGSSLDGTSIPAEVGARIGLGQAFLEKDYPEIIQMIENGDATGPIDYASGAMGRGNSGIVQRRMATGIDALRRGLTGAGMSINESGEYATRYSPKWSDDAETLKRKAEGLKADLEAVAKGAIFGKAGMVGGMVPKSGPAPAPAVPGNSDLKSKYGLE